MEFSTYGRHICNDLYGVRHDTLNNLTLLMFMLIEAAEHCGATVLGVQSKKFEPSGVTVLVLLSESHLSIHTYPEKGFAAIDCYTCGENADPQKAMDMLLEVLKPERYFTKRVYRGYDDYITEY